MWHCALLKRGTRHIQSVLILACFVCSSRKINLTYHNKHVLKLSITLNVPGCVCVLMCICLCSSHNHQSTEFFSELSSCCVTLKDKFNKVWSPFILSQRSVGPFRICTAKTFTPHLFCLISSRLSKESWLHHRTSRVWRKWTLSSWILSFFRSMAKWINDIPPFNRRTQR